MATFLDLNEFELNATDEEVVAEIVALAAGSVSEKQLADWIRTHATKAAS